MRYLLGQLSLGAIPKESRLDPSGFAAVCLNAGNAVWLRDTRSSQGHCFGFHHGAGDV